MSYRDVTYDNVICKVEESIGYLQINRPKAMNSINIPLMNDMIAVMEGFNTDPEVRVVIIYGHERAFAAGADIKAVAGYNAFEARNFLDLVHKSMFTIEDHHKPVITAVQGVALGGGLELVLASDIRIVAEDAKLGMPEISIGIFPGAGGTQRFPRNISMCQTKELVYTGDFIDGATAAKMGFINRAVPSDKVMETAVKMAKKIAKKSPLALREAKNAINQSMNLDIKAGCRAEQLAWSMLFSSEDQKEGMKAFMEGRPANFTGK
ncbi:MAG: enoyl-CoA hydratase/isomerase family protein [Methylocystaceae bacterium]